MSHTLTHYDVGPRLSEMVVFNHVAYLSGQVPTNLEADAQAQTADVLAQIDALLARAGTHKGHILEATIFLTDLAHFPAMNAAWDAWVMPGATPARATVEAKLANPKYLVEIKVSAAIIA